MTATLTAARRSLAPLALMAIIFWLSAQPNLDSGLGLLDDILRKVVHLVAYGALAVLWFWSLRPVLAPRPALIAAGAIALLYGISDEYHQSFVAGRSGSPLDAGIDLMGIILASLLLRYDQRLRSRCEWEAP